MGLGIGKERWEWDKDGNEEIILLRRWIGKADGWEIKRMEKVGGWYHEFWSWVFRSRLGKV